MRKELPQKLAEKEQNITRYIQARLQQREQHTIELYTYYVQGEKGNLLMPLLQGDLRDLLTEDKQIEFFKSPECYVTQMLNLAKALHSLSCIDDGLYYTTGIHHDVKPANILLDQGNCFLSDFGIATMSCPTVGPEQESYGNLSWFRAPETKWSASWEGIASPKSDVFSLGCIFLEFLVHMEGRANAVLDFRKRRRVKPEESYAPFWVDGEGKEPTFSEVVDSRLRDIERDARNLKKSRCAEVVRGMLDMDYESRLSAEDVMSKLKEILEGTKFKSPMIDTEDLRALDRPSVSPTLLKISHTHKQDIINS